jgi:hypothetical protein
LLPETDTVVEFQFVVVDRWIVLENIEQINDIINGWLPCI